MNKRYQPRRVPDNSDIPWETSPSGLRTVLLADVTPRSKEGDEIDREGYPILDAYIANYCQWAVWCKFEKKWHYHGKAPGHRVAHCIKEDSPYHRTGYVLRETGLPMPRFKNGRPKPPEGK